MKKKKRKKIRLTKFGKGVFLTIGLIILYIIAFIFLPNFKKVPFYEFFTDIDKEQITMIIEDEIVKNENSPVFMDEELYIPIDFVKSYIDEYIFWDETENKLTITTENNVIRMKTDELTYYVNNEPMELDIPVYNIENVAYMPTRLIEQIYNVDIEYNQEYNIATLDYSDKEKKVAKITARKSNVRYEADKKSPIAQKIVRNDEVIIFKESGKYTKIRTAEGIVGWVKTKALGEVASIEVENEENIQPEEGWKPESGKINLVFDQITKVSANNTEKKRIVHDGVDVLSPTWFSFENTDGDIKNIADKSYVEWAHDNGYQVWALISDNFDSTISHAVISSTETREYVIKQLLAFAEIYDLDGINIDFEAVPKDDGDLYVQFIRELTPLLKQQGLIVSVDTYIPKSWSKQYRRAEVGKIVDYMIVMGYDEHYSGSSESGSVASIGWSEEAVTSMLDLGIEKEKLILGIPFYTRIWKEENVDGQLSISSTAYGMQAAYDFMEEKNAEFNWLEDMGQNYAEVTEDGITYKVWLEDEQSVEKRLELMKEYDIAGCAAWKRGLEKDEIWALLKEYLKG